MISDYDLLYACKRNWVCCRSLNLKFRFVFGTDDELESLRKSANVRINNSPGPSVTP